MSLVRHHGGWVIATTFILALMLTALPLPEWGETWRPAWAAMVLIYWCMAVPQRVGVAVAWVLGLCLDVLLGSLLGQHALGLGVIAFITQKLHKRVRVLPLWQQGISIFLLVLLYQLLVLWVTGMQGQVVRGSAAWTAAFTSMLLWPWIFVLLRDLRRKYDVT